MPLASAPRSLAKTQRVTLAPLDKGDPVVRRARKATGPLQGQPGYRRRWNVYHKVDNQLEEFEGVMAVRLHSGFPLMVLAQDSIYRVLKAVTMD